jgi:hydrogenase maturation protease
MEVQLVSTRIIGIGNVARGDDGAGVAVARTLRLVALTADVTVAECSGEGAALLEAWQGFASVILVDAVSTGAPPGTIHQFDVRVRPLPADLVASSTHAFGVAEAVELGRALGMLPRRLLLYGIEGVRFEIGAEMTPCVAHATGRLAAQIAREVAEEEASARTIEGAMSHTTDRQLHVRE